MNKLSIKRVLKRTLLIFFFTITYRFIQLLQQKNFTQKLRFIHITRHFTPFSPIKISNTIY